MATFAQIEPIVFVSQADELMAKTLLPDYQIRTLPEIRGMAASAPRTWFRLLHTWWVSQRLLQDGVELVHSLDGYPMGLVGHWLACHWRIPHVITAIGTYAVKWRQYTLDSQIYGRVLEQASRICPMSQGTAKMLQYHFARSLATTPVTVVLMGSDYPLRIPRQLTLERNNRLNAPTILSVGSVKPRKGYHVSLTAFARVKDRLPDARYFIVGEIHDQEYYTQLQNIIAANKISGVVFFGTISDKQLQVHYRDASLFLLAPQHAGAKFEGFGLVFLEAGAYGLPVIGTHTGGVSDAIHHGVTGYLVDPEDVENMAGYMMTLLTDEAKNLQMGQAGRQWAETLTWERYAIEQSRIYQEII